MSRRNMAEGSYVEEEDFKKEKRKSRELRKKVKLRDEYIEKVIEELYQVKNTKVEKIQGVLIGNLYGIFHQALDEKVGEVQAQHELLEAVEKITNELVHK